MVCFVEDIPLGRLVLLDLDIEIVVYRDPGDASETWRRAEARGKCLLFQSISWGSIWFETIGRALAAEPCLVHLRHADGELFLPMAIEKKGFGVRRLGFIDGMLSDHTGPIIVGDHRAFTRDRMVRLARRIAAQVGVDVIDWRHLKEPVGDVANPLITPKSTPASYATHRLDIGGSWSDYCRDTLSTSHLAGSRRRWRRLSAQGHARFVIANDPNQADEILTTTMQHKVDRYLATGRQNPFEVGAYEEFYRLMTKRHLTSGLVHVAALMLDDKILASHWGCVYRNRFYWLMPSYDAAWSKVSPGRLLLDHLIEQCFDQGLEAFDFTIGDESYKGTFAACSEPIYRSLHPRTLLGFAYALKDRLGRRASS